MGHYGRLNTKAWKHHSTHGKMWPQTNTCTPFYSSFILSLSLSLYIYIYIYIYLFIYLYISLFLSFFISFLFFFSSSSCFQNKQINIRRYVMTQFKKPVECANSTNADIPARHVASEQPTKYVWKSTYHQTEMRFPEMHYTQHNRVESQSRIQIMKTKIFNISEPHTLTIYSIPVANQANFASDGWNVQSAQMQR